MNATSARPSRRLTVRREGAPTLSVVDWPGPGRTLVCLHGHFGQGWIYGPLAEALADWRVVASDQRGHGFSGHASTYERIDYLRDVEAVLDRCGIESAVLLGSSLGGVNAWQAAARLAGRVRALVVEDIGAVCRDDLSWCLDWPRRFASLRDLRAAVAPYFAESAVQFEDGWGFRFDREGIVRSQTALNGDWWSDWLATACPALLLRGGASPILTAELAAAMVARRPGTTLREFPGLGHNLNEGDPAQFAAVVRAFLLALN